jgi:hypothetical protein
MPAMGEMDHVPSKVRPILIRAYQAMMIIALLVAVGYAFVR